MAYVKKESQQKISDELGKFELPKITTPKVRGAGLASKSNSLDKDGKRRNLEMVNGHKPVEQLESYKQWSKVQGIKRTFIAYYSDCGSLVIACNYANIHPSTVKMWLVNDDDFRNDYDVATDMAVAILEHEARRRALAGSDRLLEFLLKSLKPDVYRERYEVKQEIAGDYIIDISNPNQTLITSAINDTAEDILDEPSAV